MPETPKKRGRKPLYPDGPMSPALRQARRKQRLVQRGDAAVAALCEARAGLERIADALKAKQEPAGIAGMVAARIEMMDEALAALDNA